MHLSTSIKCCFHQFQLVYPDLLVDLLIEFPSYFNMEVLLASMPFLNDFKFCFVHNIHVPGIYIFFNQLYFIIS